MSYLDSVLELLDSVVLLIHHVLEFLVLADLLVLLLLGNLLFHVVFALLSLHKRLYFTVRHLQHSFYYVRGRSYDVLNVGFAYLIVQLFQHLL